MEKIEYLEALTKIEFSDEEKAQFSKEFDGILAFVDQISGIELPDGLEKDEAIELSDLREDEPKQSMDLEKTLQNVPVKKDGCYVTPLVVE